MEINLNVIWWFSCFEYFWNKSLHDIASVSGSKADAVDQVPELQWLSLVTLVTPSGLKEINPNIWGQESKCQLERISEVFRDTFRLTSAERHIKIRALSLCTYFIS